MGNSELWFLRVSTISLMIIAFSVIVYTIVIDGSPLRKELLTPWMNATLVDFYTNVWFLYIWIFYKETNWFLRILWFFLLVLLGSPLTCLYVAIQLFMLKPGEPIFKILLRNGDYYPIPKRNGDH